MTTTLLQVSEALEAKVTGLKTKYHIDNVYYGDQINMVGATCVCIAPNTKVMNNYSGMMKLVEPEYTVIIYVYALNIQDPKFNQKKADQLAELLEQEINADSRLGGLVVDSHVERIESGYATVNGKLARVSRITHISTGRERLGDPVV